MKKQQQKVFPLRYLPERKECLEDWVEMRDLEAWDQDRGGVSPPDENVMVEQVLGADVRGKMKKRKNYKHERQNKQNGFKV